MNEAVGPGREGTGAGGEHDPLLGLERSLITKYRRPLWTKFTRAVKDFRLIETGDRIAVAVSGGKDSLVMAKLLQELQRHGGRQFELQFIAMDPGYQPDSRSRLEENCDWLGIPITLFESQIFKIVAEVSPQNPCYLCARMRRGALYAQAQRLGCNKLALGHHFDDVIETTLLNLFYTGSVKTMLPKLKSTNFEGLELIRPIYYVEEKAIRRFTGDFGIEVLDCACQVTARRVGNKRYQVKDTIQYLKQHYPHVEQMIMRATQNINMDCVLGWQKDGQKSSYLDFYDED
ncbi:MAG: ATP-binding protein [Syntrophomonas sp.]|nr:ATP-binding protein [Syntrophomonas sp.]